MVRRQALPELTAQALREGLLAGRWGGTLPGETKLALELGVGRNTVRVRRTSHRVTSLDTPSPRSSSPG
ncbi:MAG: hypothetical protein WCN98_02295 [Verrucomicrobiaceae bacterium]